MPYLNHSPPSSAEVKISGVYSTLPIWNHGVYGENFTSEL